MSADHSAQLLYRLREFLRARPAGLTSDDASILGACIDRYFEGRCSLDEAFGLQLDCGERHPGTSRSTARRDAALRAAGAKLSGGVSCSVSGQLADLLKRYEQTGWIRDQRESVCPAHLTGIEVDLWAALRAWPRVIGERQIRNILDCKEKRWK